MKMATFPEYVLFRLKLMRVLETAGQKVLTCILLCGTPEKRTNENLLEYLARLPDTSMTKYTNSKEKQIGKIFSRCMKDVIKRDPSCRNFDLSLLHTAIRFACEGWNEREYLATLVRKIKNTRNMVAHDQHVIMTERQFQEKLWELMNDFVAALNATKAKYTSPEAQDKCDRTEAEVIQLVHAISDTNFIEIVNKSLQELLPQFRKEAEEEVKHRLENKKATLLDPLRFVSGYEQLQVDVTTVFSDVIIHDEKKENIHYSKLLTLAQNGSAHASPHLMLVEGDAGSGKTTLLTLILSEYFKEENDRRLEGLVDYDLLLWVVCREKNGLTLKEMIESLVPIAHARYGLLLMPLLKHSSVLFIIDGLDEMDDDSLVSSILHESKDCPNYTLLSTSRPEAIERMTKMTPKEFKVNRLKLEGVSLDKRAELALCHYRCLCGEGPKDEEGLKQVLQEVAWREIFRLPLNLLFLVTLFHDRPIEKTTRITQTEIHRKILEFCAEKLQQRLAGRRDVLKERHFTTAIQDFLSELQKIALMGLLHKEYYLSNSDLLHLRKLCDTVQLPLEDSLSAFYSLQLIETEKRYQAPHKDIQEFLAASHLYKCIEQYKPGDIRRQLVGIAEHLDLYPLRNMISYLFGLINSQEKPNNNALTESIRLLKESGVDDIEDWLSLLADTELDSHSMKKVARLVNSREDDYTYKDVKDSTLNIAVKLLPLISQEKEIHITMTRDHAEIEKISSAVQYHKLTWLLLEHHFRYPRPGVSSAPLLQQVSRHDLEVFMGHLEADDIELLPENLMMLSLSVAGGEYVQELLQKLEHVCSTYPYLYRLILHVPVSEKVTAASLSPLPDVEKVWLVLSGVGKDEVEATMAVVSALCPRKEGYWRIHFPGARLETEGWTAVLEGLKANHVRVQNSVAVPATTITGGEEDQLDTNAESLLGCGFERCPEEDLWSLL